MTKLLVKNLTKIYKMGETKVIALNKINLEIKTGEFVAITGTSGSGKSTLMHLLGCLDVATSGDYFLDNNNVSLLSKNELSKIRNKKIGFVFQKFHLLPQLTTIDNIALPQLYAGISEEIAKNKALELLKMVDLLNRKNHYPYQLSGGQQQRIAVARSLINNPSLILADEPTGNLDSATGNNILELFKKLNIEKKVTIIIVTHESDVAQKTKRIIKLFDGKITSDKKN